MATARTQTQPFPASQYGAPVRQAAGHAQHPHPQDLDEAARADLAHELRGRIRGEVHFDAGSRALYAADLSIYRQVPIGVVIPRDADDVVHTVYAPIQASTHFTFPEDEGSFSLATERCFGAGKCRGLSGGTMCPSFIVTREESDTTRGDVLKDGWRDERVLDVLDLCLACKGYTGDCPVSVDMVTYKAAFLSHYYAGRLRPRSTYAMGAQAAYPGRQAVTFTGDGSLSMLMGNFVTCVQHNLPVKVVVDADEPPLPAKIKPQQALHMAEVLACGTPNRGGISLTIFRNVVDEIEYAAAPSGVVTRVRDADGSTGNGRQRNAKQGKS